MSEKIKILTIKDLLNVLPKLLIEELPKEFQTLEGDDSIYIGFKESGKVYNTGVSLSNVNKIERLFFKMMKYIPDNWADKLIAFDRIIKMSDVKYWISDRDLFGNIIKYVNQEEYQQLIFAMITCFDLKETSQVLNTLKNNDVETFCNIMLKYEESKKYKKFVAKCSLLLLTRRGLFLDLNNPNLINELLEIKNIFLEIYKNSGDSLILDFKDFWENPKIDEQEKVDYFKNNFLSAVNIWEYFNLQKVDQELPKKLSLKSKLDVVSNCLDEAVVEYVNHNKKDFPSKFCIESCSLSKVQLENLYDKLLESGDISKETSKKIFVNTFGGKEINIDEKIIFTFKNQYSFKILIQELYKRGSILINETPPQGIEVGKSSFIFFYYKSGSLKPLKFQKENGLLDSSAQKKEIKRISEIIEKIRQINS